MSVSERYEIAGKQVDDIRVLHPAEIYESFDPAFIREGEIFVADTENDLAAAPELKAHMFVGADERDESVVEGTHLRVSGRVPCRGVLVVG